MIYKLFQSEETVEGRTKEDIQKLFPDNSVTFLGRHMTVWGERTVKKGKKESIVKDVVLSVWVLQE